MLFHLMLWWLLFCEGVTWVWKDKSTGNKMYFPDWEQNAIQVIWAVSVLLLVQVKRKAWESTKKAWPDAGFQAEISQLSFKCRFCLCAFTLIYGAKGFFRMVLNFSDFQRIFANFSAILVFSLTSLETHRKAKPQSRLLWHFTVVLLGDFILISQILWFQRWRRFRVVSLHSVGSSENPQGA